MTPASSGETQFTSRDSVIDGIIHVLMDLLRGGCELVDTMPVDVDVDILVFRPLRRSIHESAGDGSRLAACR